MLGKLKEFFEAITAPQQGGTGRKHSVQLATAVLLVEVMRADPELGAAERATVVSALQRKFNLPADELDRLVELAHDTARSSNDFFAFTSVLNDGFSQPEKVAIVEHMWEVAYADGHLDAHEKHLISKVAGLLHVTHGEYIAAKMHAKAAAGG